MLLEPPDCNRRPFCRALSYFSYNHVFGPSGETRTLDPMLPKHVRYQLRYTRMFIVFVWLCSGLTVGQVQPERGQTRAACWPLHGPCPPTHLLIPCLYSSSMAALVLVLRAWILVAPRSQAGFCAIAHDGIHVMLALPLST